MIQKVYYVLNKFEVKFEVEVEVKAQGAGLRAQGKG
jgi:hypothetical protein